MRFSRLFIVLVPLFFAIGCSTLSGSTGSVVGSGGAFFGTPRDSDIESGRAIFKPEKFSSFEIGRTTKVEVVDRIGRPNGWATGRSGELTMQYWYVESATAMMQIIIYTEFKFDPNGVLVSMKNTTWEDLGRG
jgi:hypothetical protein